MTKKEKIFEEYKNVVKEYYALIGEYHKALSILANDNRIYKCNTAHDIECELNIYKEKLSKAKIAKSDAYRINLALIEDRIKQQEEQIEHLFTTTKDFLKGVILKYIGDGWGVDFGQTISTIGIVKDNKQGFIFGHSFDIHYDYFFEDITIEEGVYKVKMNYGCLGEFDACELNSKRVELLKGITTFAMLIKEKPYIAEKLKDFTDKYRSITNELRKLNNNRKDILSGNVA